MLSMKHRGMSAKAWRWNSPAEAAEPGRRAAREISSTKIDKLKVPSGEPLSSVLGWYPSPVLR